MASIRRLPKCRAITLCSDAARKLSVARKKLIREKYGSTSNVASRASSKYAFVPRYITRTPACGGPVTRAGGSATNKVAWHPNPASMLGAASINNQTEMKMVGRRRRMQRVFQSQADFVQPGRKGFTCVCLIGPAKQTDNAGAVRTECSPQTPRRARAASDGGG